MKLSALKHSILASLLFHLVVLGSVVLVGNLCPVKEVPIEVPSIRITLLPPFEEAKAGFVTLQTSHPSPPQPKSEMQQTQEEPKLDLPKPVAPIEKTAHSETEVQNARIVAPNISASTKLSEAGSPQATKKSNEKALGGPGAAQENGAQGYTFAKPKYQNNPDPTYPTIARRRHQEGVVILVIQVTANGKAAKVFVKKSSGFPLLDEAKAPGIAGGSGGWIFSSGQSGGLALRINAATDGSGGSYID